MPALQGETLLTAWERCQGQPEPLRALLLLHASAPDSEIDVLATLPLAERNRLLLELRAETFGQRMEGFAKCERCGASLEFELDTRRLAGQMLAAESESWLDGEREYRMRPANTSDLLAAMRTQDEEEAKALLLARTTDVIGRDVVGQDGIGSPEEALSEDSNAGVSLAERFETLNASAEIQLNLGCAQCGEHSQVDLNIAAYLGRETSLAARRLLGDIHQLAHAYGWSEESILAMSNARRMAYLAMLDA